MVRVSHPFRVFISYAHEDLALVLHLDAALRDCGLAPVWDREIRAGVEFTDDIKRQIATAHVFMALFTQHSMTKPWVHQEIGFAVGIDVPVLAITIDQVPVGMIAGVQALVFQDNLSTLPQRLQKVRFDELVERAGEQRELARLMISNQVAELPEERTRLMVDYAKSVPQPGRVRQRAYFSSFSLPAQGPEHPDWDLLDREQPRSRYYRRLLSEERSILKQHAEAAGCSLILHPIVDLERVGAPARRVRLRELLAFLKSVSPQQATVAISEASIAGSLTVLGDHLTVTALPPRPGSDYEQTLFVRHAPTVFHWLRRFDAELESLLQAARVSPADSRDKAVAWLEEALRSLPMQ